MSLDPARWITDDAIVFHSLSAGLAGPAPIGVPEVYLHELSTGETRYLGLGVADDSAATHVASNIAASASGTVAFTSGTPYLAPKTTPEYKQVFVRTSAGEYLLVSHRPDGFAGNRWSRAPSVTADGEIVVFSSAASDLVPDDTNAVEDVFLWTQSTGEVTRFSVGRDGEQANGPSAAPTITPDGRVIVFWSRATNLGGTGGNGYWDLVRVDRSTGESVRVTSASSTNERGVYGRYAALSDDGTVIAFRTDAPNLVAGDSEGSWDVFVYDAVDASLTALTVGADRDPLDRERMNASISAGGRYVVFSSTAALTKGDDNELSDVFVYDRASGELARLSVGVDGDSDGYSIFPVISRDGLRVFFHSAASNLVWRDRNNLLDVFVADNPLANGRPDGATTTMPIVRGTPAPRDRWPDAVVLYDGVSRRCSGVLIAPSAVLTAGHCDPVDRVILDDGDLDGPRHERAVVRSVAHPTFGHTELCSEAEVCGVDLRVLELDAPFDALPRALASPCAVARYLANGSELIDAGYGTISPSRTDTLPTLMFTRTVVVDVDCTETAWCDPAIGPGAEIITDGTRFGGICAGDSGGPVYIPSPIGDYLIAIHSTGALTCGGGLGGNARVDGQFDWIEQVLGYSLRRATCDNAPPMPRVDRLRVVSGRVGRRRIDPRDPDVGDSHVFAVVRSPRHGDAALTENGELVYRADVGYVGEDEAVIAVADDAFPPARVEVVVAIDVAPSRGPDWGCRLSHKPPPAAWGPVIVFLALVRVSRCRSVRRR